MLLCQSESVNTVNVKILDVKGTWRSVANAARVTIGLEDGQSEPTSRWKKRILLAEHSPIRKLFINWRWTNLLSWVSVHFVRHKHGIEHWVRSQRSDRTDINRDELKQSELIEHECEANAQAIINISRKRLCNQASIQTIEAWIKFLTKLQNEQPELVSVCVPDCVYRGWCYEYNSCGYHLTEEYQYDLNEYRKNINKWGE